MEMHKIVKKLEKKSGKIITLEDIGDIVDPGSRGIVVRDTARLSQVVYALKGQGVIQSIRNGLYYVSDGILEGEEIIETHYWELVRMIIDREVGKDYVIGGEKSLELLMMDYSIPESLIVYTRDTAKRIALSPKHEILLRTMITGEKKGRSNAYGVLYNQCVNVDIKIDSKWEILSVLGYEAALLDTLTIHDHAEGIAEAVVLKFLKRYESKIERGALGILVSMRYIRAVNRLRSLTKAHGYERLYENCLDVIKKEGGGCFVTI